MQYLSDALIYHPTTYYGSRKTIAENTVELKCAKRYQPLSFWYNLCLLSISCLGMKLITMPARVQLNFIKENKNGHTWLLKCFFAIDNTILMQTNHSMPSVRVTHIKIESKALKGTIKIIAHLNLMLNLLSRLVRGWLI